MDNADWGEAYNNLHKQVNVKWAWDSQNLGESLYTITSMKAYLFCLPPGETRYSVIEEILSASLSRNGSTGTSPKNF